jgi:hypothetical protein
VSERFRELKPEGIGSFYEKFPHKAAILINYEINLLALMKIAAHIYSNINE